MGAQVGIEFINRLKKRKKHFSKWSKRRNIFCYRLYDRDLPDYSLIIDIYEEHAIVYDMFPNMQRQKPSFNDWFQLIIHTIVDILNIDEKKMHIKLRQKRKGNEQHEKLAEGSAFMAREGDLQFFIYPDNWIDVGLFLDHRNLRARVKEMAREKDVLNLFCYTGSFTVYAADGGARSTCSVDLSNRYLSIAQKNMELNHFTQTSPVMNSIPKNFAGQKTYKHLFVRQDARFYLEKASANLYDIIILDPPVFSKNKKAVRDFDVKRDYPELLNQCLRLLRVGGHLFFSTNLRKFSLKYDPPEGVLQKEITAYTIPEDFRNKKIHRCYEFYKSNDPTTL